MLFIPAGGWVGVNNEYADPDDEEYIGRRCKKHLEQSCFLWTKNLVTKDTMGIHAATFHNLFHMSDPDQSNDREQGLNIRAVFRQ